VRIPVGEKGEEERQITTGLSDAIKTEVTSGLKVGDQILEKPVKKIE
jgi:hypothetical protein